MKCMIVEDETPAVKVLESHISHFSDLQLCAVHNNAMDAFADLQKKNIDILFLDIQLPKMSGIQFVQTLKQRPAVIMTTAHREFALDGYELEITDYLLKPIAFDRFAKAIAKVYQQNHKPVPVQQEHHAGEDSLLSSPFIYIKSEREYVKVLLHELLYIESLINHIKIVTLKDTFITLMSISQMEEKLPRRAFLRVHRSFIVSLDKISKFNHTHVTISNKNIPVGRHYKQQFMTWIEQKTI